MTRQFKTQTVGVMIAAAVIVAGAGGYALSHFGIANVIGMGADNGEGTSDGDAECANVLYYYDPMVPDQHFDKGGPSPFMDMQLVPKCADEKAGASSGVRIDPAVIQNLGIRTAPAQMGILEEDVTVTGMLAYNGGDMTIVQPRSGGFVQRTYGLAPNDIVVGGAPIADLLIPEWGGAQREYFAVAATGDAALTRAARERLRLLGMSEGLIGEMMRSGKVRATITITAPKSGAITALNVRSGMTVTAGQTLAEISGYSPIWLEAAVPEAQAGEVRVGQSVRATLTAFPGEAFTGRIIAILPAAQEATRTITVRVALPNPRQRLQPGMFAQVIISPERSETLLVASEAIIRTGKRTLVMIAQDGGGFRPAEVEIGREANGRTQVLAGLSEGEQVVISGQFLLDSEASLSGIDIRPINNTPVANAARGARP